MEIRKELLTLGYGPWTIDHGLWSVDCGLFLFYRTI
jgi:hypothetical protein